MSLCDRLKQEISAATSQREARKILLSAAQEEVGALPWCERSSLSPNSPTWLAKFPSNPTMETVPDPTLRDAFALAGLKVLAAEIQIMIDKLQEKPA